MQHQVVDQRRGTSGTVAARSRDRGLNRATVRWALGRAVVVTGPGSDAAVRRALEDQAWGRLLLHGARGRTFPADRVIDVLLRVMAVAEACRVREIEINPLVCDGFEAVAVDALVVPEQEGDR